MTRLASSQHAGVSGARMRLSRRQLIRKGLAASTALLCAGAIEPRRVRAAAAGEVRRLSPGVHLFIDDDLIASQKNVERRIHPPRRLPRPIVTGRETSASSPTSACSGTRKRHAARRDVVAVVVMGYSQSQPR